RGRDPQQGIERTDVRDRLLVEHDTIRLDENRSLHLRSHSPSSLFAAEPSAGRIVPDLARAGTGCRARARSGLAVELCEDAPRDTEALDPSRHAGIDGDLMQDGLDLLPRDTVADRAAQVKLPFLHTVEAGDQAEVDHGAGLGRNALVSPDGAPAVLIEHVLKRTIEVVRIRHGFVHVVLAEDRLPLGEARLPDFPIHS